MTSATVRQTLTNARPLECCFGAVALQLKAGINFSG
jgi:hypothetical protein